MRRTDAAHLVPALVFSALLGVMLLASGASLTDALLVVCTAYVLVSLLEMVFDLGTSTSSEHKSYAHPSVLPECRTCLAMSA
jgi:hypothetical protein